MTIRHYHTRYECFATEEAALQWAASMEQEGWFVIHGPVRDSFAKVFGIAKPWGVTVQYSQPYAVARGVAA